MQHSVSKTRITPHKPYQNSEPPYMTDSPGGDLYGTQHPPPLQSPELQGQAANDEKQTDKNN